MRGGLERIVRLRPGVLRGCLWKILTDAVCEFFLRSHGRRVFEARHVKFQPEPVAKSGLEHAQLGMSPSDAACCTISVRITQLQKYMSVHDEELDRCGNEPRTCPKNPTDRSG